MPERITKDMLAQIIEDHEEFVKKVLSEDFIIPEFMRFKQEIKEIFDNCKKNNSGKNADYIPELKNANPNDWGVSVCTVDGQQLKIGDTGTLFSV